MKLPFKAFAAAGALLFLLSLAVPAPLFADGVDYQEFQEDPLETAIRKLASPGDIEWDKEEMISGGAPDFIKDMKWPLKSCTFSRGFSRKRRRHTGVDLLAPKGTPVLAVLDGVVEVVSNGGPGFRRYGKVIVINHNGKLLTLYSHNSSNDVKVGQRVKQGDVIAKVGRTGRATANHLHFEVRNAKGTPLDPLKYLPKEGMPVKR
ncbi:MAG: M23 family metallopeptidase [Cloacibacillus porcorum]|nr:M23 family metallopeptidase [Cloacibacillus porcorum]